MFAKTVVVALFAAVASAQLTENFNPITRPLNEAVTAGEAFEITWTPTTEDPISLILLKGPSENAVPVETIVANIENTGSYTWTPPSSYGPGLSETTGYGIQIIDPATGEFQYSTQFGLTVDEEEYSSGSTPLYTATETASSVSASSKSKPLYTATVTASSVSKPLYTATVTASSADYVAPTGYPISNSSIIQPTKPITKPSLPPSASPPAPSAPDSGASHFQAGLGVFAGVAAAFFML